MSDIETILGDDGDAQKKEEHEEVIRRLDMIIRADITPYLTNDYTLRVPPSQLPDDLKAAIKSIKKNQNGVVIELNDKNRAIEQKTKYLGLYNENVQPESKWDRVMKKLPREQILAIRGFFGEALKELDEHETAAVARDGASGLDDM